MRTQRPQQTGNGAVVRADELEAAIERATIAPAQGGSASAGPVLGLIAGSLDYNRYRVQLAEPASPGAAPAPIQGEYLEASNAAEPFDEPGELDEGEIVLLWPGQGEYVFFCPRPTRPAEPPPDSYWARVASGGGPDYSVVRQRPADGESFVDADGVEPVSAANVWQLSVDPEATAAVPAGAIVRVFEEPDGDDQPRRFFFYPIHAVYR